MTISGLQPLSWIEPVEHPRSTPGVRAAHRLSRNGLVGSGGRSSQTRTLDVEPKDAGSNDSSSFVAHSSQNPVASGLPKIEAQSREAPWIGSYPEREMASHDCKSAIGMAAKLLWETGAEPCPARPQYPHEDMSFAISARTIQNGFDEAAVRAAGLAVELAYG